MKGEIKLLRKPGSDFWHAENIGEGGVICDRGLRIRWHLGQASECALVATDEPTPGAIKMMHVYGTDWRIFDGGISHRPVFLLQEFNDWLLELLARAGSHEKTVYVWVELPA